MFLFSLIPIKVNSIGYPLYLSAKMSALSNYAYPPKPVRPLVLLALKEISILFNVIKGQCQEHLICALNPSHILKSGLYPVMCLTQMELLFLVFSTWDFQRVLYTAPPCLLAANPISKYHCIFQFTNQINGLRETASFSQGHVPTARL